MTRRRVVITGMGSVSPFGVGVPVLWENVKNGKSGIKTLTSVNLEDHTVHVGGEVQNFNPEDYLSTKESARTDRYIQFALVATEEAVKDSKLNLEEIKNPYRFGVIVSSGAGGFRTFQENYQLMLRRGYPKCSPFCIPNVIADMAAGKISIKYGAKGINKGIVTACASSAHAIGDACRSIQWNEADIMIAGGSESTICNIGLGAFTAARTLSKRNDEPEKASRPYDKDRDGFVMAEGAGIVILEELEHAKKRGVKIYGEVVGYAQTADAYDIVAPAPDGAGAKMSMSLALKDAGITVNDIDYINTHGTSTGLGDIAESHAIADVFGDVTVNKKLKVSSTKSMMGHLLGASGAIETIISIKAINDGFVPPTINLDNQDEKVANLNYVPHKGIDINVNYAMSNSFGFGGHNVSLIYKKYSEKAGK